MVRLSGSGRRAIDRHSVVAAAGDDVFGALLARVRSWYYWPGGLPVARALGRLVWPRATAGALVVRDGHVLAVDAGDYLMLPVGGMRYGESFADAARREVREETGVDVRLGEQVREGTNAYGGVEVLYAGRVDGDDPASTVSGDPRWVPIADVRERRWRYDRDVAALVESLTGGD